MVEVGQRGAWEERVVVERGARVNGREQMPGSVEKLEKSIDEKGLSLSLGRGRVGGTSSLCIPSN